MSAERGRALAVLLLVLPPALARADDLGKFGVFGLHLGDSGSLIQERHPGVFLNEVPYVDPAVGTRYEVGLGRVAVERVEGVGTIEDARGRGPIGLRVALTGDDRLYELQAMQQLGGPIDCKARVQELRATYGAPDVQVAQELLQWIERQGEVDRILEVRCFREGRMSWRLADQRALADYVAGLRARLAPYIEQARRAPP
jgi:hypothetical protein